MSASRLSTQDLEHDDYASCLESYDFALRTLKSKAPGLVASSNLVS